MASGEIFLVCCLLCLAGNDRLAALTASRQYVLRVDLTDWNNTKRYAEYNSFRVLGEEHKYRLSSIGTYSGDAGVV